VLRSDGRVTRSLVVVLRGALLRHLSSFLLAILLVTTRDLILKLLQHGSVHISWTFSTMPHVVWDLVDAAVVTEIQATTVALECRTGHMSFAQGLAIPDLNAVVDYPATEESRHAAGFVVATCGQTILSRNDPDEPMEFSWQRLFWNCCYRLEPCEYE